MKRFLGGHLRQRTTALMVTFASAACNQTLQAQVVIDGGQSVEDKARIAGAIASDERLALLRSELRERFPTLSPSQAEGVGLSWNQTTFQSLTGQGSSSAVVVIVEMRYESGLDPRPIVDAARETIEAEVRATAARYAPTR